MLRQIEPELMIDANQCKAYAESPGGAGLRQFFLYNFKTVGNIAGRVADLGCGPGLLDIELCKLYDITVDGFDGSEAMLAIAKSNIESAGLQNRISLHHSDINNVEGKYDVIICNNTLHHMHDPNKFWNKVKLLAGNTSTIYVTDILRPNTEEELETIINTTTVGELPIVVTDFRNSLKASFTADEIRNQIKNIFPTAVVTKVKMDKISSLPFEMVSVLIQMSNT